MFPNAFACVDCDTLGGTVGHTYYYHEAGMLNERHRAAMIRVDAQGETKHFKTRTGRYMGDTNAAKQFRQALMPPIEAWRQVLNHERPHKIWGQWRVCPQVRPEPEQVCERCEQDTRG